MRKLQDLFLLPVAMVLLGLLCRINKLLHCGQGSRDLYRV